MPYGIRDRTGPQIPKQASADLSCAMNAMLDWALGRRGTPAMLGNKAAPNR
jgi:hypothetical protein